MSEKIVVPALGESITEAKPTSVEIKGVLVIAHSNIDLGPPSTLDATIYRSNKLESSFKSL